MVERHLTRAHQTAGAEIAGWMIEAGMQVRIDAVGNVIGRYAAADPQAPILMSGSHFDTVRAGGRFDGRLGILAPIVVVAHLHRRGERLPFHLDVVAFAEIAMRERAVDFRRDRFGDKLIGGPCGDVAGNAIRLLLERNARVPRSALSWTAPARSPIRRSLTWPGR